MYKNAVQVIDLAELDETFEGYTVKIKNPNLIPYGKTKGQEADTALTLLSAVVLEWNLTDLDQPDQILLIPSQDPTVLDRVPSLIVQYLMVKCSKGFTRLAQQMGISIPVSTPPSSTVQTA